MIKQRYLLYNCKLFVLCLALVAMHGCCSFKKYKTTYKLFDSLDNYLAKSTKGKRVRAVIIDVRCHNCFDIVDNLTKGSTYKIAAVTGNEWDILLPQHQKTIRSSSRFVKIGNSLFPVFLVGVDDYFTQPTDSASLATYSLFGRELRYELRFNWIIADLDRGKFYPE